MLDSFISYLINVEGKPKTTVKAYKADIQEMLDFFNKRKKKIRKITTNDLYCYMTYLTKRNLKPVTRARHCSVIKVFYKFLQTQGMKNNPAINLHKPKVEKKEVLYLNLEDTKKLLKTVNEEKGRNHLRNEAIITLFLNLGIRLAELIAIDIDDIDFSTKKIVIKGKGLKERTLYLNKKCISVINKYRGKRKEGALFLSERKQRISRRSVQYIVENEIRKANLDRKITTHKLRHTCATNMYKSGADIRLLQKILGHETILATEIYVHVEDQQMKNAIDRIGGLYEKL